MDFEYAILDFIRDNLSCTPMDAVMQAISFLGNAGWFWIVVGVTLSIIPKTRRMGFTVCLALIFSLIFCNLTLKPLVDRVRPYDLIDGIKLIITAPTDASFPSGHTSASFAAACAIFAHNKKWGGAAIALAVLIAFSRLYLYVHFPSDVLGGIFIGTLCAVFAYYIIKFAYKKLCN